jgi:hypothetical protein
MNQARTREAQHALDRAQAEIQPHEHRPASLQGAQGREAAGGGSTTFRPGKAGLVAGEADASRQTRRDADLVAAFGG